jgi:hypothetical protein
MIILLLVNNNREDRKTNLSIAIPSERHAQPAFDIIYPLQDFTRIHIVKLDKPQLAYIIVFKKS